MRYKLDRLQIKKINDFSKVSIIVFTLVSVLLCFGMGYLTDTDDTIENIEYYYRLRDGGDEYLSRGGWAWEKARIKSDFRKMYEKSYYKTDVLEPDDYYFHLYCTRKRVDENLIYKIARDKYTEIFNHIELLKTDKNHWTVCSGEEILGYAESQGGFFLKNIVFLMYKGKIRDTQKPASPPKEEAKPWFYEYVVGQWQIPTKAEIEHEKDKQIKTQFIFLIVIVCTYFIMCKREKKRKINQAQNQEQNSVICQPQQIHTDTGINQNPADNANTGTSQQWKPQAPTDKSAEQNRWNEANPKWNPDIPHTFN